MDRIHSAVRRLPARVRTLLVRARVRALLGDRRGGTAIEYGLIIALVVLAMLGALNSVASTTGSMWNNVSGTVLRVS
jgi:pilus assembly protein Flp/PilA